MSGAYHLYDLARYPMNPLSLTAEEVVMYKAIFLDAFGGWDQATLDGASPALLAGTGTPPFLVIGTDDDLPGFTQEATDFTAVLTGLGIDAVHRHLDREDYSDTAWQTATALAAEEPTFEDYVGHYAEVVAINPNDRDKPPTTWILDFMAGH